MIELLLREMKNLSRILIGLLCFAPFAYASAAPVATTNGSNLTSFNPSTAYNNQWATMTNGRYDSNLTAKADFKNCEAVISRCAKPRCANGGCTDATVASAIVSGCVQYNDSCKQYGDDLVQYMSAQLVASSNAKINEQNVAVQQAAAAAAQQQSQQQMAAMQQQMQQMQQQMAEQQAQSQQQLQEALAAQAAQSQAAVESMKVAATEAAKQNEAGISAYQQEAINRGISTDVLERQKIGGQILTEIENAEVSLKEVKAAMETAFEYAKCDARGSNCDGPKRIKKWRELAGEFVEPYENSIDKIYEALLVAQAVGIDLSQIYMMLDDSCELWGQYMCPQFEDGSIVYSDTANGQKGVPYVCPNGKDTDNNGKIIWKNSAYGKCSENCYDTHIIKSKDNNPGNPDSAKYNTCMNGCLKGCRPCTLLKTLSGKDEVYEGWVNAESSTNSGNTTVVACASGVLNTSKFFASRAKRKSGANIVDIDTMDMWIKQTEPNKEYRDVHPMDYCNADQYRDKLEKSMLSKVVPVNNAPLCVETDDRTGKPKTSGREDEYCSYINPIYAICDVHPYNAGLKPGETRSSDTSEECSIKELEENCKRLENQYNNVDCSKVRWGKKEGAYCVVKWCGEKFRPENGVCIEDDEWKDDGAKETGYKDAKSAYDSEMKARYGDTREMVGLKVTVVSQQMYKLYEYLNATLRRLKTQLEKATLTAALQAAGAKTDDSSSGLLGGGASKASQYRDCYGKNMQGTLDCLRENYSAIAVQVNNKKCDKNAQKQLKTDIDIINSILGPNTVSKNEDEKSTIENCKKLLQNYNGGMIKLDREIANDEAKRNGRYRDW